MDRKFSNVLSNEKDSARKKEMCPFFFYILSYPTDMQRRRTRILRILYILSVCNVGGLGIFQDRVG